MKNIMLCCNTIGIGGVETVILNQVKVFNSKGYNVYVVAGKGEYSNKIAELGGEFIEIEFPETNDIDRDKINQVIDIIRKKEITEIHIHKYQCIPSVLVAAFITGIPYFAYEHGIKDTRKYYTWNYPIYKSLFPIYFKNAYKIIAITPKVSEFTKKEYGIIDEKYVIIHNGIDFNIFKNQNPNYDNCIKKVLIVSRIDEEKLDTIYNGIDVFKQIIQVEPEAKLYIVGGGNAEQKLIEYLKKSNLKNAYENEHEKVKLLGKQTDVIKYIKEADLLLGVDRCAIEAIAMKVPIIITGYDGIKGLVKKENINTAMEENFSGLNMPTINSEECIRDILYLKENKKKIVEELYEFAKENLNCYNNYINIPENQSIDFDWFQFFGILKEENDLIEKNALDIKEKYEKIQKIKNENAQLKEENEKIIQNLNTNIDKVDALEKERYEIYNSKRWIYAEKLSKIFHKK